MNHQDIVFIENCTVVAKHGYYKEEHSKEQRFIVSIYAHTTTRDAGLEDDLKQTLNYEHLRMYIYEVLSKSPHNLIESLAEEIAQKVLEHSVSRVEVEIKKPDVWKDSSPGVRITRSK
jgi:dihydroneopterin aldolase